MNKGSTRITIRIGDEMLDLVDEAIARRNERPGLEPWTRTDFIMQAIADKLNHLHRSRKTGVTVAQRKIDEFRPREVTEE